MMEKLICFWKRKFGKWVIKSIYRSVIKRSGKFILNIGLIIWLDLFMVIWIGKYFFSRFDDIIYEILEIYLCL